MHGQKGGGSEEGVGASSGEGGAKNKFIKPGLVREAIMVPWRLDNSGSLHDAMRVGKLHDTIEWDYLDG